MAARDVQQNQEGYQKINYPIRSGMQSFGPILFTAAIEQHYADSVFLLVRLFRVRSRFHFASRFSSSSFDTLNILRRALSNLSASVLPGTCGAGNGLIWLSHPSALVLVRLEIP